jgi:phosphopantetheinyl transferase
MKINCSPSDINIQYNHYGKPFITRPTNIYFNISHSMNFVVVVFYNHPIGVEIEYTQKFNDGLISEGFFSSNEIIYLNSYMDLPDNARKNNTNSKKNQNSFMYPTYSEVK